MTRAPAKTTLSRRGFLVASSAASVAVLFGAHSDTALAETASAWRPNAWIMIGPDGAVTLMSPAAEMGQGTMTALPLILAEELDADWRTVRVRQSPGDPKLYGNPKFHGAQTTIGSMAVLGYYDQLRLAGAQARRILLLNAASHLNVPVESLRTEPGVVVHAASNRRIGYGELARTATIPDPLPVIQPADLKPRSQFRYVGKDMPRVDLPAKVDGSAVYGSDVQLSDMVYATVLHPPVQGETAERLDDAAARAVRGVMNVVALPGGVAVIARTVEAALKGRAALKVDWSQTAAARGFTNEKAARELLAIARHWDGPSVAMVEQGDAATAFQAAPRVISAEFVSAPLAHVCMEPMSATARVTETGVELWASNQSPSYMKQFCAAAAGVPEERVTVHSTLIGGGFGRRTDGDEVIEAVLLAKTTGGRPVKVVWTREDDIQNDKFRPLTAQRIEVALAADGTIAGWRHRIVNESYMARADTHLLEQLKGKDVVSGGGGQFTYDVPAHRVEWVRAPRGVAAGAWRSVGPGYAKFAIETVIDEVATAQKIDPAAFRLSLLKKNPRAAAVIQTVMQMSDWTAARPPGRALGLAYSDSCSRTAVVAEVSVDPSSGAIKVHHLWGASDPGLVVQPRNAEAQLEGGMVMGLSAALYEEVEIVDGAVQQTNFDSYTPIRLSQVPPMTVKVLSTDAAPTGMGEAGVPPVAPAIANAVARLTGKRLRSLPMKPLVDTYSREN